MRPFQTSRYRSRWIGAFFAFLILLLSKTSGQAAQTPEQLFESALIKETGDRDLQGAVDLYVKVTQDAHATTDLRAKAYLRMGFCYERLDKTDDAVDAYHNVFTLPTKPSADIVQAAQANVDRLQARKEQERLTRLERKDEPFLPPAWTRGPRIELGIELGKLQTSNTVDFQKTTVVWGSGGYQIAEHLLIGLEGGYLLPRSYPQHRSYMAGNIMADYNVDIRNSAAYGGPFARAQWGIHRWVFAGSAGVGALVFTSRTEAPLNETLFAQNGIYNPTDGTTEENRFEPALSLAGEVRYRLSEVLGIGLGLRDLLVFHREDVADPTRPPNTFDDTRVVAEHLLSPFVRITVLF